MQTVCKVKKILMKAATYTAYHHLLCNLEINWFLFWYIYILAL